MSLTYNDQIDLTTIDSFTKKQLDALESLNLPFDLHIESINNGTIEYSMTTHPIAETLTYTDADRETK